MKKLICSLLFLTALLQTKPSFGQDFTTVFEKSNGTSTATYQETILFYKKLAAHYPEIAIDSIGETDSGFPLHLVTLNPDKTFDFEILRKNKVILLINNGIHPGEPDGIDATMLLFRDMVQKKIRLPKHVVLATIPVYNIGGSLNRNTSSRVNQNGPSEYGFRGNARNYDLNRDFIKSDSKNAKSFAQIFHRTKPDVFIDNHVSNGADYQYTLTHLFTQHNKLGGELGDYLHRHFMPTLEQKLSDKQWDITPYVNVFNKVPENGFSQFMDWPRYSTGYTTLWNTIGMMVETHMLKPYKQRVEGTYVLMETMIHLMEKEFDTIKQLRQKQWQNLKNAKTYPVDWKIDTSKSSTLKFKGYEGTLETSDITGMDRLKYHRNKPFVKDVKYQDFMVQTAEVNIPEAYIIPKGWWNVIDLLRLNQVEMRTFEKDTSIQVESYRIDTFNTRKEPFEGHYQHYNTKIVARTKMQPFKKGDYYIPTNQNAIRYLLETLEPQAPDSFFNWNFFDAILQQKEGFSPYVWEDLAYDYLNKNESLKQNFEKKKKSDPDFAGNWYAQLDWIYKQSPFYETEHLQYPVYRVAKD